MPVAPAPLPPAPVDASSNLPSITDGGIADAAVADAPPTDAPSTDAPSTDAVPATEAPVADCPEGMILVDTSYCPNIERRCVDEEYSPQNHITICHKFAKTQRCLVPEQRRRFCVDEYEYPNQKGAHPPWMVSWYDAQATCLSVGKRLCYESEWVTACEGPDKTPFPYGYSRDNTKCNVDNTWIKPELLEMYGKDPEAREKELSRLDQSVPSGTLPECVSGFGVHDLTGNFDEWVTADRRHDDKSEWAALKGGAWGHVRNACRPVTTSHPPDFTYYFIAFRCCKNAPRAEGLTPEGPAGLPAVEPANRAPIPSPVNAPGPSATKVAREKWPRPKR
ncbi:MAG TPA: SUMF1/EgtB/PvdO family nonheme iron enzyme [Polyangiaceae bacterium]|nr:SUMF1/EgtB/PvdO family nonheme iron enzyme [Polyangiaceae bacterium]